MASVLQGGQSVRISGEEEEDPGFVNIDASGNLIIGEGIGSDESPDFATLGELNTVIGRNAAANFGGGNRNLFLGAGAGGLASGSDHVLLGQGAARNLQSGGRNVIVGSEAGGGIGDGSNNVIIGYGTRLFSGSAANTLTRSVLLGANSDTDGAGTVTLGAESRTVGDDAVALGHGVSVVGSGAFSLQDRLVGRYVTSTGTGLDTYAIQMRADAVQVPRDSVVAYMDDGPLNDSSKDACWTVGLDSNDLVFRSKSGTEVRLVDDFFSGVLDFTGQHRCPWSVHHEGPGQGLLNLPGLIVCADGTYDGDAPKVGRAIPRVRLSLSKSERTVFGVVSRVLSPNSPYRMGHLSFRPIPDPRQAADADNDDAHAEQDWSVEVNSAGEGSVYVCDEGGPIKNGDLLVTSSIPGVGMRLNPGTRNFLDAPWTVFAKATCSCRFSGPTGHRDGKSGVVLSQHPLDPGNSDLRVALIGCTYRC